MKGIQTKNNRLLYSPIGIIERIDVNLMSTPKMILPLVCDFNSVCFWSDSTNAMSHNLFGRYFYRSIHLKSLTTRTKWLRERVRGGCKPNVLGALNGIMKSVHVWIQIIILFPWWQFHVHWNDCHTQKYIFIFRNENEEKKIIANKLVQKLFIWWYVTWNSSECQRSVWHHLITLHPFHCGWALSFDGAISLLLRRI